MKMKSKWKYWPSEHWPGMYCSCAYFFYHFITAVATLWILYHLIIAIHIHFTEQNMIFFFRNKVEIPLATTQWFLFCFFLIFSFHSSISSFHMTIYTNRPWSSFRLCVVLFVYYIWNRETMTSNRFSIFGHANFMHRIFDAL